MGRSRLALLLLVLLLGSLGTSVLGESFDNSTDSEDEYLEDPLEKWLAKFDTDTLMLAPEVGETVEEESVGGGFDDEVRDAVSPPSGDVEEHQDNPEEEEEEDYKDGSSVPILLKVKKFGSFLNPDLDYKVEVESLVAEGGSVLITLESIDNMTTCGVGGFSMKPFDEAEMESFAEGADNSSISPKPEGTSTRTTIVAVTGDSEAESSTTWTLGEDSESEWEEQSKDLWWAIGRLGGGGLLTLLFTPPECGCLVIKAYYALPVSENITLVVGPEAYPTELERLLCVDPLPRIQDNLIEPEMEESIDTEDEISPEDNPTSDPAKAVGRGRRRKLATRRRAKMQRKQRMQEARQAIRQAGRRVTKQRIRNHLRQRKREDGGKDVDAVRPTARGPKGKWARKQARKARKHSRKGKRYWKGKKPWRKHKNHSRKHRNKHRRNRHHGRRHNATEDDSFDYQLNETTTVSPLAEEDLLADLLLGDDEETANNSTDIDGSYADDDTDTYTDSYDIDADSADALDADGASAPGTGPTGRKRRKQRRQKGRGRRRRQRKMKNKDKKKGSKFCCKQGIKFKKMNLVGNATFDEGDPENSCNRTDSIVLTFALHQFDIDNEQCLARYQTCCSKFTLQLWENVKARKSERKAKRKQQRKAARQERRRQGRRQRRAKRRF